MYKETPNINMVKQYVDDFFKTSTKIERVKKGMSTFVYRVEVNDRIYYLRVLPEVDMSFNTEVYVHNILNQKDILVPHVIHYETKNQLFGLSTMFIEEINGCSMEDEFPTKYQDILFEAGKQIAKINQTKVKGFSWIDRNNFSFLKGEKEIFKAYFEEHLTRDLKVLPSYGFNENEVMKIKFFLSSFPRYDQGYLVHGDFDMSHIFYNNDTFTGIIDFGEMMGSSPLYDLGHFRIHDGQVNDILGFEYLLRGYQEITQLNKKQLLEIELWALFVGVRRLGMIYGRNAKHYSEFLINQIRKQLALLND